MGRRVEKTHLAILKRKGLCVVKAHCVGNEKKSTKVKDILGKKRRPFKPIGGRECAIGQVGRSEIKASQKGRNEGWRPSVRKKGTLQKEKRPYFENVS